MRRITASSVIAAVLAGVPSAIYGPTSAAPERTLVVTAYEYSFQSPDSLPAGVVSVRLVNRGTIGHQVSFARLDDSSSLARVMKSLVDYKAHTGGIQWTGGVESAIPGGSGKTILVLRPGRYVIVCAYDHDGQRHMSMGMLRPLVVTAGAANANMTLPATATTIRLSDYHVAIVGALHSGSQLVRIENIGAHWHQLSITRIRDRATIDEIMKWDGKSQPAPLQNISGGAAAMEPATASVISLDLEPGRYELECGLSDDSKSKPHFLLGMHADIAIR
jgi:hypothetical protein